MNRYRTPYGITNNNNNNSRYGMIIPTLNNQPDEIACYY